jgi:hypothetical protein
MALRNIGGGDNRFFNNIFIRTRDIADDRFTNSAGKHVVVTYGLAGYDDLQYKSFAEGNVFYNGAAPYKDEVNFIDKPDYRPQVKLEEKEGGLILKLEFDKSITEAQTSLVTSEKLGTTIVSEAMFEYPDGTPYIINKDFMGRERKQSQPMVGPLEQMEAGKQEIVIW